MTLKQFNNLKTGDIIIHNKLLFQSIILKDPYQHKDKKVVAVKYRDFVYDFITYEVLNKYFDIFKKHKKKIG